MGKKIFDWLVSPPWAEYLQRFAGCGRNVREKFFSDIYPNSLTWLLVFTVFSCLFYYYYLNGRFGRYYKRRFFYGIMIINAVIVGGITLWSSEASLKIFTCSTMRLSLTLAGLNALYSAGLYFLLSILIIKVVPLFGLRSTMGYKTPF